MANKSRRKQTQGFVIPFPVVGMLVTAMLLLLAYVCLDIRSKALGARIKALEQQQSELAKKYDLELMRWEAKKSPRNIERMLAQNNSGMIWPDEKNIVRLCDANGGAPGLNPYNSQMAQLARADRPLLHD